MNVEQWMKENIPNKDSISRDAVEILIKLAWVAGGVEVKKRMTSSGWTKPKEIVGPYEIE